jgi:hypothetical protein
MTARAPAALPGKTETISPELRRVLATLREAVPGAYLVGGAVRDLITGRQPFDLDVVTPGDAHAAAEAAGRAFSASVFALDEARAQYRVTLPGGGPVREIDISSAPDIVADLRRRDFTVNAIAAPIEADGSLGQPIDPTGGLDDLEAGLLRMVSEAALREDPLRLLRAARLAHELQLEIEPETELAVHANASLLNEAAPERQREELVRMLASRWSARAIRLLDSLTLLQELLPEITAARGVGQPFPIRNLIAGSLAASATSSPALSSMPTSTRPLAAIPAPFSSSSPRCCTTSPSPRPKPRTPTAACASSAIRSAAPRPRPASAAASASATARQVSSHSSSRSIYAPPSSPKPTPCPRSAPSTATSATSATLLPPASSSALPTPPPPAAPA